MSDRRALAVVIAPWAFVAIAATIGAIVGRVEAGTIALLCQMSFSTGLWARGWVDRGDAE